MKTLFIKEWLKSLKKRKWLNDKIIQGIKKLGYFNKYFEDMNICHIKVGNKERTFCKCGKVYTSVVKKCEICGMKIS